MDDRRTLQTLSGSSNFCEQHEPETFSSSHETKSFPRCSVRVESVASIEAA